MGIPWYSYWASNQYPVHCHVALLPRGGEKECPLIRWHSTTCKTCAHYLWNLSSGDLAGYGCSVVDHLTAANLSDSVCPSYLEAQYASRWVARLSSRNRIERLPDYTADVRRMVAPLPLETAEWEAGTCPRCGEYWHQCRCEPEDAPQA